MLKPFAAVDVADPVTLSAATLRPVRNVEVAAAFEVRIPVLSIEKSVVVAAAVDEPMAKSVVAVSPLFDWIANFANGVDVPMPIAPEIGSGSELADVVAGSVPKIRLPMESWLFPEALGKSVLNPMPILFEAPVVILPPALAGAPRSVLSFPF